MKPQALPGFRDFYPDDLALRDHIFRTWRSVATRYGFEEYDGPPLEPLDLYTAKSGDEIVDQLYSFVDKGDRKVALRPEMTPTLARMVAARSQGLKKPIRWFSIPQLFRYERQQRGRLREHFQFNCDLIGETDPLADAEIIALAIDVMRGFGLTSRDVKVRLSDRRVLGALLRGAGVTAEQTSTVHSVIDKIDPLNKARLSFDQALDKLQEAGIDQPDRVIALVQHNQVEQVEKDLKERETAAHLKSTIEALSDMGLGDFVELDLKIVRGLAYYTGTVFELFDAGRTLRAVCGGGRYDNLLESLGGVQLPALGFGMGDVVLAELLRERNLVPPEVASQGTIDLFVAFITQDDRRLVLELAHRLRDEGLRVEYALSPQTLGKQLKLADARRARLAVVAGPDERAKGEIVLKNLRTGSQETVPLQSSIDVIKARIHG